jgi:hypothetical protein
MEVVGIATKEDIDVDWDVPMGRPAVRHEAVPVS